MARDEQFDLGVKEYFIVFWSRTFKFYSDSSFWIDNRSKIHHIDKTHEQIEAQRWYQPQRSLPLIVAGQRIFDNPMSGIYSWSGIASQVGVIEENSQRKELENLRKKNKLGW